MAEALPIVYLNGEFVPRDKAAISPFDRGFLYGDGIYEVIACYGSKLFRLHEHLVRLENSLAAIRLANPHQPAAWRQMLEELVARNDVPDVNVYVQVTRGSRPERDHRFPRDPAPTVFAMCQPAAPVPASVLANGISAVSMNDIRWSRCDIKTTSLIGNVLLRQAAADAGADEALLLRDGEALEFSASTLFVVKDGQAFTPPEDTRTLPGITGIVVREAADAAGVPLLRKPIPESLLRDADEIWLASTTRELLPVTRVDDQPVGDGKPGPLWRKVHETFQKIKTG